MIRVASFTRYDLRSDRMIQPKYKKPIHSLRADEGYVLIKGTEEEVPIESIDDEGRYYPRP